MTTKWTHLLGSLWCKTALLAMGLAATTAGGATFESAIADATWHLDVSPFECRLWQDIPYTVRRCSLAVPEKSRCFTCSRKTASSHRAKRRWLLRTPFGRSARTSVNWGGWK